MGASIIGGYVYRGSGEPGLDGTYFFGDFASGKIFSLSQSGGVVSGLTDLTAEFGTPFGANQLSSFSEDGFGNLYVMGIKRCRVPPRRSGARAHHMGDAGGGHYAADHGSATPVFPAVSR